MDCLSLTAKLGILISFAVGGLALLGLVSYRTLEEVQGTVAEAVENRMAVTRTIDQNASEVAGESGTIAGNFDRVAASAGDTTRGAGQIDTAASEVAQMASRLQALVSKFRFQGDGRTAEVGRRLRLPSVAAADPSDHY